MAIVARIGTRGIDPAVLRPGKDLVLDPAAEHGLTLPEGVAVDDRLDRRAREEVDRRAHASQRSWRERRGPVVVDGLDLGWIFEVELLADCFLPAARLLRALEGEESVIDAGVSPGLLAVVGEAGHGIQSAEAGTTIANPRSQARPTQMAQLIRRMGVPSRVRGNVVVLPYWHLTPVVARLADASPGLLTAFGLAVPGLSHRQAVTTAVRGGWIGHPGRVKRARARRDVEQAPAGLAAMDALDAMALALLRQRAPAIVAAARRARSAFDRGLRLAVLPWDSPPEARVVLAEARRAGRDSLVVQHGFDSGLRDPDKRSAERVALWSERDRELLHSPIYGWPDEVKPVRGDITITGNPGAEHFVTTSLRQPIPTGPAVVLVEYPARLTSLVDGRVSMRHVATALRGIAEAGRHREVVLRPHPADPAPDAYLALAGQAPGLHVVVDARTPIEPLMHRASLCVGALSTATLQAIAIGVPSVFLDVTGLPRPWPFDGTIPLARDRAELAALIECPSVGRQAACDALGARAGATDAVCALIESLI